MSIPSTSGVAGGGTAGANVPNAQNGVPFEVHIASMLPTYKPFTKVYYDPTQTHPQIGQVVIFYFPVGVEGGRCASKEIGGKACEVALPGLTQIMTLSRVVGVPGDTIAIRDGHIVRNGQPVSEPNIPMCGVTDQTKEPGCEYPAPVTVPPESYYVVGDYRELYQSDSRAYGAVPQAALVGTVLGS